MNFNQEGVNIVLAIVAVLLHLIAAILYIFNILHVTLMS
jgi:hypothetical protein